MLALFGRTEPWEVCGPSSEKPELWLNASIAGLRQMPPTRTTVSAYLGILLAQSKPSLLCCSVLPGSVLCCAVGILLLNAKFC